MLHEGYFAHQGSAFAGPYFWQKAEKKAAGSGQ